MSKYRHDLPQLNGGIFLTDGGMETTLIFHDGVDLPHFASFVLLDSPDGRQRWSDTTTATSRSRAEPAPASCSTAPPGAPTPTGAAGSATTRTALKAINGRRSHSWKSLRAGWERPGAPCVISGAIGPRGDGYKAGHMDAAEAEDYHARADRDLRRRPAPTW